MPVNGLRELTLRHHATENTRPLYERWWFIWLVSFGLASIIVLTDASQDYVAMSMHDRDMPAFGRILLWPGIWWYAWALIAPGIYLFSRHFSFSKIDWFKTFLIHIVGCVSGFVIHVAIQLSAMTLPAYSDLHPTWEQAFVHHTTTSLFIVPLIYWCIVALTHGLIYFIRYKRKELHTVRLESELHKAQLQTLKSQLQPHFLFNTLNAVSTLMYRDVRAADAIVAKLGDLLRTTIDLNKVNAVPLHEEITFLKKYLEIEKTRFQERLTVVIEVAPEVEQAMIPNLILQPLVENAVKHGIDGSSRPGRIEIRAWRVNGIVCLRVADNGPGLPAGDGSLQRGTGLSNTLERLEKLYGADYDLTFSNNVPHGLIIDLCIPCVFAPAEAREASADAQAPPNQIQESHAL